VPRVLEGSFGRACNAPCLPHVQFLPGSARVSSPKMPGAVNNEADVVFNRANVALAKSKRLIASWLPPKTENELANEKTEEELEKEDQELFAPVPELCV